MIRAFETNSQRNEYLLDALAKAYENGDDPATVWKEPDEIQKLTPEDVQAALSRCVDPSRYVKVMMVPE